MSGELSHKMRHEIRLPVAVRFEYADALDRLEADKRELVTMHRANLNTLLCTRARLVDYGKAHGEIDTAVTETVALIAKHGAAK